MHSHPANAAFSEAKPSGVSREPRMGMLAPTPGERRVQRGEAERREQGAARGCLHTHAASAVFSEAKPSRREKFCM